MYLLNIFKVSNIDYDDYYLTLFTKALKYGMTREQFWYNDLQEFYSYEQSYIERLHEVSHIQGLYSYIALQTLANNLLAKKGEKALEYPSVNIYASEKEKRLKSQPSKHTKITRENLQSIYMSRLANCY